MGYRQLMSAARLQPGRLRPGALQKQFAGGSVVEAGYGHLAEAPGRYGKVLTAPVSDKHRDLVCAQPPRRRKVARLC